MIAAPCRGDLAVATLLCVTAGVFPDKILQPSMRTYFLLLCLGLTSSLAAAPAINAPAVSILGQTSMTSYVESTPPTASSLRGVEGVAIDPTTGKLFVSESGNHRVLRFSSTAAYQTGATAEAVFGQPDFVSSSPNRGNPDADMSGLSDPSADSFDSPSSICVDANGRLWVADYNNARVLRFDGASSKPSGTATADGVIGQPDFTSADLATNDVADSGFMSPTGIAVDGDGRLWVSDASISRILRFDDAATLSGDVPADGYFGARNGDFDSDPDTFDSVPVTASSLGASVYGLAVDAAGNLWVADTSNNRVLCHLDPASKASGAAADLVLGQPGFVTRDDPSPPTAASFNFPYTVAVSSDGVLWVADYINQRLLGFVNALGKTNGAAADLLLGQADFITGGANPFSPTSVNSPSQIAFGREGSLFVGEFLDDGSVKRWSDPVTLSTPASVTTKRPTATIRGRSSGAVRVQYKVTGQGGFKNARGTSTWSANLTKLKRKTTPVTVRAVAFDDRVASGLTRVKLKVPKPK